MPSQTAFDKSKHLAWSDVAIDDLSHPQVLKVHLKRSKCDQSGREVDIYVGRTNDLLCPVVAILSYMAQRGSADGPFFIKSNGTPLVKAHFVSTDIGQQFAGHCMA